MTRGLSPFLPPRNSSWVCQAFKQLAAKTITVSPRPRGNTPLFRTTLFTAIRRWRFLIAVTSYYAEEAKTTTVARTFGISSRQIFIARYYENFLFRLSGERYFETLIGTREACRLLLANRSYEKKDIYAITYYCLSFYLPSIIIFCKIIACNRR